MNDRQGLLRLGQAICLVVIMGISGSAWAGFLGFGDPSWQEEVLLHDGSKIIVNRSQSYGGRHEIGQSAPIKEQTLTFTLPNTSTTIVFKSEYGEDIGRANFELLALHILNGTPYIVTAPNLCLSYNKWGRPNPPYVIFRYDSKAWTRIALEELPTEFKDINLVVNSKGKEKILTAQSIVTAELVKKLNGELEQPEYKTILREPLVGERCPQYPSGPKAPIPIAPSTSPK
ncbi:MAG: hypothetical protein RI101_06645 [Nitrospira sp.]|nr:hypothetical protein [Nitrospira sp.]